MFICRRPPPPKRSLPYQPPPPIGPSGMGIGHQRPEDGKRNHGSHALRSRNIIRSSKPHHLMQGRLFNMLRMNQRSSETDVVGYDDDSQLEWRNGISNLDWHPRKKQVVFH